jgi:hypothetical protein
VSFALLTVQHHAQWALTGQAAEGLRIAVHVQILLCTTPCAAPAQFPARFLSLDS